MLIWKSCPTDVTVFISVEQLSYNYLPMHAYNKSNSRILLTPGWGEMEFYS